MERFNILLASDGSEGALAAAEWVNRHYDPATTRVTVVNVAQMVIPLFIDTGMTPAYDEVITDAREQAEKQARKAIEKTLDRLDRFSPGHQILIGQPVESLIHLIQTRLPDLVVMGRRGHTLIQSVVLGSVSFGVLQRSPVPVLIVEPNQFGLHPGAGNPEERKGA